LARFTQAIVWGWRREGYQADPCYELDQAIAISLLEKWQIRAAFAWMLAGRIAT
jgi:hypothetical protein